MDIIQEIVTLLSPGKVTNVVRTIDCPNESSDIQCGNSELSCVPQFVTATLKYPIFFGFHFLYMYITCLNYII